MSLDSLPLATPRPGRRRRNLPEVEWRARIQEAARIVVLRTSYEAATMEDIARVAGISRSHLYSLYPSRRQVLADILAEDSRALAGEVLLRITSASGLEEKLRALVSAFFDFADRAKPSNRILYGGGESTDPTLWRVLAEVRQSLVRVVQFELTNGVDGTHGLPGDIAAGAVIALAEGAATAWAHDTSMPKEEAVILATQLSRNALGLV